MAGETIAGRYRLLEPLGRGAMSAVWLAYDDELERHVAVKLLAPNADRARFEREALAVAALAHPNICSLYDYGQAEGRPYMVLEYLPNGSLEERLQTGRPLPDAETLRVATEIAAGLAHAHERGLVHRDLKPSNVLFDSEGRAKISDFGIARMGSAATLTEAGTVLGTASYISPEQASGLPAGPTSDVYSFGVILFRMLTGVLPFVSTNAMELVRMHRDEAPRAVADVRPDAPARLETIVTRSLAKDIGSRPADGAALLRELQGAEETATLLVPPAAARRRRPVVPIAAVTALLLVAGGALAVILTNSGTSGDTPPAESLTVPSVPSASTATSTTTPTTAAATTTATTTTSSASTAQTTTARTTTAPATTTTTPTTTAAPPTTTAATTTSVTSTDTTPTTTAAGTTTTAAP
ncbi:MAG TPA: serine/threonine-protein kinase [Gaiellaceae bacterium]|nr:serine/threonine-protein kinase [Gaiellaceae bacterium]